MAGVNYCSRSNSPFAKCGDGGTEDEFGQSAIIGN